MIWYHIIILTFSIIYHLKNHRMSHFKFHKNVYFFLYISRIQISKKEARAGQQNKFMSWTALMGWSGDIWEFYWVLRNCKFEPANEIFSQKGKFSTFQKVLFLGGDVENWVWAKLALWICPTVNLPPERRTFFNV